MSISKTLPPPLLGILAALFMLSACASLPSPTGPHSESAPASPVLQAEVAADENIPLPPLPAPELVEITEELTAAEPEVTADQELWELTGLDDWEVSEPITPPGEYDFPVVINRQVEYYLDFFQNKQPQSFARWLSRSGRYVPLIKEELRKAGLPLDLAYLPMIESGYSLTALSRAQAVGPWQFMSGTALDFGLRIDEYVDERRDPIKSTRAAIQYLSRLNAEFDDWLLAVASYNTGEGKIRRTISEAETTNFWKLSPHLYSETKRYVPKLMAAIIIAKDPGKYGFGEVIYEDPLEFETIEVPRRTPLQAVAVACGQEPDILLELNRELRQAIVPPQQSRYSLKVPKGMAALVSQNLPRVQPVASTAYKTHVVRERETVSKICRQYKLKKLTLLKTNNLRSADLSPGQRLRIPYKAISYVLPAEGRLASRQPAAVSEENLVRHTVKPGETLSKIAKKYGISADLLATWNQLQDGNHIKASQQLALYLEREAPPAQPASDLVIEPTTYKLLPTDAAKKPAAGGAELAENSSAQPASGIDIVIEPATYKLLPIAAGKKPSAKRAARAMPPASQPTYYRVQGGDTLAKIARRHNVSTSQIKRWNNLKGDVIQQGSRLLLRVTEDVDV